jgi:lysophospholipase L1-like esterase
MRRWVARAVTALCLVTLLATPAATADPVPAAKWCTDLATGDPIIDILGDSIMTGDVAPAFPDRWWNVLRGGLRGDIAPNAEVWTGGSIDGSATADYIPGGPYVGHTEFTVHQPSLILMDWGINDWAGNVPVAVFKAQYQQIIDRVRVLTPTSTIMLIHTPWVYNPTVMAAHGPQQPYAAAINELAATNSTLLLRLEWGFPGDRLELYAPDLVHPNAAGQRMQAFGTRTALLAACGRG